MSKEQVIAKLRAAGVPREAFSTTLAKEGMDDIRAYVTGREEDAKRMLYLYQTQTRSTLYSEKAELAFFLLAKELVLSGEDVFCCDLVNVHTALFKDDDEATEFYSRLDNINSGFIAIRHFHDKGGKVEQFMTPYESAYFASWLIRKFQDGVGFILLGGAPIMEAVDWWPASFLGYLRSRSIVFEVRK